METLFARTTILDKDSSFHAEWGETDVRRAITMHPAKTAAHMIRVHKQVLSKDIETLYCTKASLQREIIAMDNILDRRSNSAATGHTGHRKDMSRFVASMRSSLTGDDNGISLGNS
jgi:hypothetical protein